MTGNMDCHILPSSVGLVAQVGSFRVHDARSEGQCDQKLTRLLLLVSD